MNIYELTDELRAKKARFEELLDESFGEITPELAELEEQLDAAAGALEHKVDAYAKIRAEFLAEIEAFRTEERRLASRRKSRESAVERLERRLVNAMTIGRVDKINTPTHTVSVSKSYSVGLLVSEDQLPSEWTRTKVEAKKSELLKALHDGQRFQFAELVERAGVRIR